MKLWQRIKQWRASRPPDDVLLNLLDLAFWIGVFGITGGILLIFG
jgi:hypothetical protein